MTLPKIDLWAAGPPRGEDERGADGRFRRSSGARARTGQETAGPSADGSTAVPPAPPDAEVVAALRGDDLVAAHAALETLYRMYAPAVARFAYGYVRSRSVAEDVVADVFLAVWARREEWRPKHGSRAYLYAAARHRALNVLRADARAAQRELVAVADIEHTTQVVTTDDIQDTLQQRLDAAMAALPEDARRLAELRWRDGMTPGEIAAILGIDRSAVDNRLSRLVKRLRALATSTLGRESR